MSRFSTILTTNQLVKDHLYSAQQAMLRNDYVKACEHLIKAVREQQTAINNLASLTFQPRKKVRV